jgi:hypothetical protein
MHSPAVAGLTRFLTQLISETSGLSLDDTLALGEQSPAGGEELALIREFRELLGRFRLNDTSIEALLEHPVSLALEGFFRAFPIPFRDEHIHLTGSLDADFVYPRLAKLLDGPQRALYESKIAEVYGRDALPLRSVADVDRLIRLGESERFDRYLKILYLPKLILTIARRIATPRITWPAASGARRTSARCASSSRSCARPPTRRAGAGHRRSDPGRCGHRAVRRLPRVPARSAGVPLHPLAELPQGAGVLRRLALSVEARQLRRPGAPDHRAGEASIPSCATC